MKLEAVNSMHVMTALMCYFRYKRNALVASEVDLYSYGKSDIVADTGKVTYDVEIKTTINDLKRDFKKYKHSMLDYAAGKSSYWVPNYFYFCLPVLLIDKAKVIINEQGNKFGILSYDYENSRFYIPEKFIKSVQIGKKIHNRYDTGIRKKIVKRLSSELCIIYQDKYDIRKEEKMFLGFNADKITLDNFEGVFKCRKKPIVIHALQINFPEGFIVTTPSGKVKGEPGDYLMFGPSGEKYPCKKDIFEKTYTKV